MPYFMRISRQDLPRECSFSRLLKDNALNFLGIVKVIIKTADIFRSEYIPLKNGKSGRKDARNAF
jgi:hypothetical protein